MVSVNEEAEKEKGAPLTLKVEHPRAIDSGNLD